MDDCTSSMLCRYSAYVLIVVLMVLPTIQNIGGLKITDSMISEGVNHPDGPLIGMITDIDQRLMDDLIVSYPDSDLNGTGSGELQVFFGEGNPLMDLEPSKADITIIGRQGWRLGASFASWDFNSNGWNDLVIGCPGAGKVLIFDSLKIAISVKGRVFLDSDADWVLESDGTNEFGTALHAAEFSGDNKQDLMVLSTRNSTVSPTVTAYLGGSLPERGVTFTLPINSVTSSTRTTSVDIEGRGHDALVFSAPEHASVKWLYLDVENRAIVLPGSDPEGTVRFDGTIASSGNTFGWDGDDDGWDTSPAHVYDDKSGTASVRYNQATGNVGGYNRSVDRVKQLQIEVGGGLPNGDDMSGAYGATFHLTQDDVLGANAAILSFNYLYENWGFENDERIWVKGRLWNSNGDEKWLGRHMDSNPEPDPTEEIFTMRGINQGGQGINTAGSGLYSADMLEHLSGAGKYYIDMGGKISRWTNNVERAAFCFDNVSFTIVRINVSTRSISGMGGLGSALHSQDVDLDGHSDLLISSPADGTVRIFLGGDPHWGTHQSYNAFQCNTTLKGKTTQGFGASMAYMPKTPFSFYPSLLVSDPNDPVEGGGSGALYHYLCPLPEGDVMPDAARDIYNSPDGMESFGFQVVFVGDRDYDDYPEWRALSWSEQGNLTVSNVDPSPNAPYLRLVHPRALMQVKGLVEIRVEVYDRDGDSDPYDLKVYRSLDNRTWIYLNDVHRVEDDVAMVLWNTSRFENGGHFLKFSLRDAFGLETVIYSNRIDVINHRPPQLTLAYPLDGDIMSEEVSITARTVVSSWDVLSSPVRFFMSRDGENFTSLTSLNVPDDELLSREFVVYFNTFEHDDGPIWFMVNVTTEYGLGTQVRNSMPAFIDNDYPPNVTFQYPAPGSTVKGTINVTARIVDRDMDHILPPVLNIRAEGEDWVAIGDMGQDGDTFFFEWDTTTVENGHHDLAIDISDLSLNNVFELLEDGVVVHNPYPPSVTFEDIGSGEMIRGDLRIRAFVNDRDLNIAPEGISFYYKAQGSSSWTRIDGAIIRDRYAETVWYTRTVPNGRYDLRVDVRDQDNLSATDIIEGVTVDNAYPPNVSPHKIPYPGSKLSGEVTLMFNVSDDEPVDVNDIMIEVFTLTTWEKLEGVSVHPDSLAFVPWGNMTYYVVWDTLEKGLAGHRRFPDYQGYLLRINVTDADGEVASWQTSESYEVLNQESDHSGLLEGPSRTWLIAAIFFGVVFILLILLLLFFLVFAEGRSPRKGEEAFIPAITAPPPLPPEPAKAPVEPSAADIYAPVTGLGEQAQTPPSIEELEDHFDAMNIAQEAKAPPEPIERIRSEPSPPRKRGFRYEGMDIDSILPSSVLPKKLRVEEEEDWGEDEFEDWEE
ncbi:MAG: hypothetical protein QCI82_04450 [Candidatus Thermoplasmatota archaeon]|nr:hypothetical protein [Candidatus Thermoplasmatota archaeon]